MGQAAGLSPREIVRLSVAHDEENWRRARNYTFIERVEERQAGSRGVLKSGGSRTFDVTLLEGSPYRRLIARDDKPLPPEEERKEREKLEKNIRERRNESEADRQKRIADWQKRRDRDRALFREIADAFDFTLEGEQTLGARTVYVIAGVPRPGYQPKDSRGRMFAKFKGRLWIDKNDLRWVRVESETIDAISFGWFLARLTKGMHFEIEQDKINNDVWMTRFIRLNGVARLGLVKKLGGQLEITYRDFRKFQTDSTIVPAKEVPE